MCRPRHENHRSIFCVSCRNGSKLVSKTLNERCDPFDGSHDLYDLKDKTYDNSWLLIFRVFRQNWTVMLLFRENFELFAKNCSPVKHHSRHASNGSRTAIFAPSNVYRWLHGPRPLTCCRFVHLPENLQLDRHG